MSKKYVLVIKLALGKHDTRIEAGQLMADFHTELVPLLGKDEIVLTEFYPKDRQITEPNEFENKIAIYLGKFDQEPDALAQGLGILQDVENLVIDNPERFEKIYIEEYWVADADKNPYTLECC